VVPLKSFVFPLKAMVAFLVIEAILTFHVFIQRILDYAQCTKEWNLKVPNPAKLTSWKFECLQVLVATCVDELQIFVSTRKCDAWSAKKWFEKL